LKGERARMVSNKAIAQAARIRRRGRKRSDSRRRDGGGKREQFNFGVGPIRQKRGGITSLLISSKGDWAKLCRSREGGKGKGTRTEVVFPDKMRLPV